MVDPKELRIGNWIQTNSGILKVVNGINYEWEPMEHIVYDDTHIGYSNDELSPIPITPEWLERLGFERKYKNENTIHWVKFSAKHLSFVITECSSLFGMEYKAYGADHCPQIFHIHQLQNLYHALTGQELTVKELTAI